MKGIELISEIIAMLIMIGLTAALGGVIIIGINFVKSADALPLIGENIPKTYIMGVSPIYPPIKNEEMLLAFLEITDENSGVQVKKILTYAAYQNNVKNVFVDGKEIDLTDVSTRIFSKWFGNDGYMLILNINGYPYVLSQNKKSLPILPDNILRIRRISYPVYLDKESAKAIKVNYELPIKITLDLYVI